MAVTAPERFFCARRPRHRHHRRRPMRAVFETLGMQDVVAKSIGSSNPYNMVRATFDALKHQDSPRSVAARRNIKVSALQARRRDAGEGEQATD
jgi:small subunit ribosomal protein S5